MKYFFTLCVIICCFTANISSNPISLKLLKSSENEVKESTTNDLNHDESLEKTSSIDKGNVIVGSTKAILKMGADFALTSPVFPKPGKIVIGTAKSAVDGTKTLYQTKSIDEALKASMGPAMKAVNSGADIALSNPTISPTVKIAIGTGKASIVDGTQTFCKTKCFKETGKSMVESCIDSANKALFPLAYRKMIKSGCNLVKDICEGKDLNSSVKKRSNEALTSVAYALPFEKKVKIGVDFTAYLLKKTWPADDPEYTNCRETIFKMMRSEDALDTLSSSQLTEETESDTESDNNETESLDDSSSKKLLDKK